MLERAAAESDLYREPIGRVLAWHKELVKGGIRPEAVVATIRKAVYADEPRYRYTVPRFPSVLFVAIARFLPGRMADAVVRRILALGD